MIPMRELKKRLGRIIQGGCIAAVLLVVSTEAAGAKDPFSFDPKKPFSSRKADSGKASQRDTRSSKFYFLEKQIEAQNKATALKTGCVETQEGSSPVIANINDLFPKTPADFSQSQIAKTGTVYYSDINQDNPTVADLKTGWDICKGNILTEYYCTEKPNKKGSIKVTAAYTLVDCKLFGAVCDQKARKCILNDKLFAPYCNDSDGDNIFNQGVVTAQAAYGVPIKTGIDACGSDGKSVFEFTCNDTFHTIVTPAEPTPCPAGNHCENGACTPDEDPSEDKSSCIELPETAETAENKGIEYADQDGNVTTLPDQCFSDTVVWEMTCDGKEPKVVPPTQLPCGEGEVCNDGICVPDTPPFQPKSCTDLDPANDVYQNNSGATFNLGQGPVTAKDGCVDDKTVNEMACDGKTLGPKLIACKTSEYCLDGLCVPQGCNAKTGNIADIFPLPGSAQWIGVPQELKAGISRELYLTHLNNDQALDIVWDRFHCAAPSCPLAPPVSLLSNGQDGVFSDVVPGILSSLIVNTKIEAEGDYEFNDVVGIADVTGEGMNDIIVMSERYQKADEIRLLRAQGLEGDFGTAAYETLFPLPGGNIIREFIGAGLFDSDSLNDLVTFDKGGSGLYGSNGKTWAYYSTPMEFTVYYNQGNAVFDPNPTALSFPAPAEDNAYPEFFGGCMARLNQDDRPDLIGYYQYMGYDSESNKYVSPSKSYVFYAVNDAGGKFASKETGTIEVPFEAAYYDGKASGFNDVTMSHLRCEDLNSDGLTDLVMVRKDAKDKGKPVQFIIHVWLQNQQGTKFNSVPDKTINLTEAAQGKGISLEFQSPLSRSMAFGDLNGDGLKDLTMAVTWHQGVDAIGPIFKGGLWVFLGENPADLFAKAPLQILEMQDAYNQIKPSDAPPETYFPLDWGSQLVLGDMNGDGCDDPVFMASENYYDFGAGYRLAILLSKP